MRRLLAWLQVSRWVVWLVVGVAAAVVLLALRQLFRRRDPDVAYRLPEIPRPLQERVERAEEAATVARIAASTRAEAQKEALSEVMQIPEDRERRRRLAEMLKNLPE